MPKIRDVIGHATNLQELGRDLESGNVAHAYLFSGPRHLGKMTTARWFALQLLQHGENNDASADDIRASVERLTHPDLLALDQLWIENICDDWDTIAKTSNVPQQHRAKKPAAKTDVISIDDIRALQARLHETGTGTYRCCLIRSVERMQDAAANAFLKILEEPPPGLVFILTTQKRSVLLPTITSRTRVLAFRRLPHEQLLPLLEDEPEEDTQFILSLAQGAPGIVRALRDDPDELRAHKQVHAQASAFWQASSLRERLQLLKPLHDRGAAAEQFLLHLALSLRHRGTETHSCEALHALARGLQTNAHRQLLSQQFAVTVTSL